MFSNNKRSSYGSGKGWLSWRLTAQEITQNAFPDFARNRQIHNCWLIAPPERKVNVINRVAMAHGCRSATRRFSTNAELHIEDNERVCLVGVTAPGNPP